MRPCNSAENNMEFDLHPRVQLQLNYSLTQIYAKFSSFHFCKSDDYGNSYALKRAETFVYETRKEFLILHPYGINNFLIFLGLNNIGLLRRGLTSGARTNSKKCKTLINSIFECLTSL